MNHDIVTQLQVSTCAVGYCTVPIQQYVADTNKPFFNVVGTGFMVANELVMTNRHVIQGLLEMQADIGFPDDQRVLLFVQPTTPGRWKIHVVGILTMGMVTHAEVDVGMISIVHPTAEAFGEVMPLAAQTEVAYQVAEPVAICGYPFGSDMLQRENRVYRWGPVLQQGHISAISPFTNTNKPLELLLDIRIAGGMSGSAVARSSDGKVIGIVHSAWKDTTAVAFPLNASKVAQLIADYEAQKPNAG
jgi:V8-like Glu-specific endopeptidase